jgi:hypothetical protein
VYTFKIDAVESKFVVTPALLTARFTSVSLTILVAFTELLRSTVTYNPATTAAAAITALHHNRGGQESVLQYVTVQHRQ